MGGDKDLMGCAWHNRGQKKTGGSSLVTIRQHRCPVVVLPSVDSLRERERECAREIERNREGERERDRVGGWVGGRERESVGVYACACICACMHACMYACNLYQSINICSHIMLIPPLSAPPPLPQSPPSHSNTNFPALFVPRY